MRIHTYESAIPNLVASDKTSVADTIEKSASGRSSQKAVTEDTASFASGVASIRALTDAAFYQGSREAKVASLQQAVQSGQYQLDPARLAAALSTAVV